MNNKSTDLPVRKSSKFLPSLHKSTVQMNKSYWGDIFSSCSLSLVNNNNDLKHICSYAQPANPYRAAQDNRSLGFLFHILVAGHTKQSLHTSISCQKQIQSRNRNHIQTNIIQSTLVSATKLQQYYICFNRKQETSCCELEA